jgi:hypothetical protein
MLRWAYTLSQCAASGSSTIGSATLTLSQVYVLFFIVLAGLGLASVVVILERLAGAAGKTQVRAPVSVLHLLVLGSRNALARNVCIHMLYMNGSTAAMQ